MLICAAIITKKTKPDITSSYTSSNFPDIPAPSGSASLSSGINLPSWEVVTGASGYLVYLSTSTQQYPDPALYSYRYEAPGGSTTSRSITGIAAGTYYYRIAAYEGSTIGDLSFEIQVTAS